MTTTDLIEPHDAYFKVMDSDGIVSRSGTPVIKLRLEILNGQHIGRNVWFYYVLNNPFSRHLATSLSLATTEDTVKDNIGKRFFGRVTVTGFKDRKYNGANLAKVLL